MNFMADTKSVFKTMQDVLKISLGIERLIIFVCSFTLVCHIFACLWIFMARLKEEDDEKNWIKDGEFDKYDDWSLYTTSFYYVVTTITTVGYGDIGATNYLERIFAIILMLLGVFSFSLLSSSVASIV